MANPLRRMVSSSQVTDWFPTNPALLIPSRFQPFTIEYLLQGGGGGASGGTAGVN